MSMPDAGIIKRARGINDAEVFRQPTDMARVVDVVAVGTIVGHSDGFELHTNGTVEEQGDVERTVVLEVQTDELLKGDHTRFAPQRSVYVSLSRGIAAKDGDEGEPSAITPVTEFEEALPLGTRVVVMAWPVRLGRLSGEIVDPSRGVPQGVTVLSGIHPSSLTIRQADGGASGWMTCPSMKSKSSSSPRPW
jgi:hypothetical protein